LNALLRFTCVLVLALPAAATNISSQGTFATDDQIQLFDFTVSSTTTVTLVSLAYGGGTNSASTVIPAGGFDSFFTLFAADGSQINTNNDGGCGVVNAGNGGCLDAYLSETLNAGSYILALTESGNDPAGNLADGFIEQGQGNFTCAQGFCDAFGNHQNGTWAVDIRNVQSVGTSAAPEPATFPLVCVFLSVCAAKVRPRSVFGRVK
jgi:hypothetical protein